MGSVESAHAEFYGDIVWNAEIGSDRLVRHTVVCSLVNWQLAKPPLYPVLIRLTPSHIEKRNTRINGTSAEQLGWFPSENLVKLGLEDLKSRLGQTQQNATVVLYFEERQTVTRVDGGLYLYRLLHTVNHPPGTREIRLKIPHVPSTIGRVITRVASFLLGTPQPTVYPLGWEPDPIDGDGEFRRPAGSGFPETAIVYAPAFAIRDAVWKLARLLVTLAIGAAITYLLESALGGI